MLLTTTLRISMWLQCITYSEPTDLAMHRCDVLYATPRRPLDRFHVFDARNYPQQLQHLQRTVERNGAPNGLWSPTKGR